MNRQADLLGVDWTTFDPWRVQPVRRRLMARPLLQIDALLAPGPRQKQRHGMRAHSNRVAATLSDIANASAWLSLLDAAAGNVHCATALRH